jgi:hypothetical protein
MGSSFSHHRKVAAYVCFDEKFYHFGLAGATAILAAVNLELSWTAPGSGHLLV